MINERESNINVIKYKIESFETVDDFTLQMLKANPILGIIPIGRKDDEFLIPISSYMPLRDYLKENVQSVDEVLDILKQYENIINVLDNYMIPAEELILDFDFAFMDGDVLTLMLIPTNLSYLHSHTKYEFTISALLSPNYKSDEERLKVFDLFKEKKEEVEEIDKKEKKKKEKKQKEKKERPKLFSKVKEKVFSKSEDDIFDFFQDETLPEGVHVIKVRSTGAEYPLMFGPDFIGTDPSKCSICFFGNATMSAEHCSITLSKGRYFLADLNSRTGTLINGIPLDPGKTYELHSADLITVAGEELVFSKRT